MIEYIHVTINLNVIINSSGKINYDREQPKNLSCEMWNGCAFFM